MTCDTLTQESLPDAAKTMQLECSALACVGEGGSWQYRPNLLPRRQNVTLCCMYLEGDVAGVRRYELLAPAFGHMSMNSTFGSASSAASQLSLTSSSVMVHSIAADCNAFTGDVYAPLTASCVLRTLFV